MAYIVKAFRVSIGIILFEIPRDRGVLEVLLRKGRSFTHQDCNYCKDCNDKKDRAE